MGESVLHNRRVRQTTGQCGGDRRMRSVIAPPPYLTAEGEVQVDRRSCVDRRATWIREFSMWPEEGLAA